MRGVAASALLVAAEVVQAQGLAPLVDAAGRIPPPWRVAGLPNQPLDRKPLTRFVADTLDGRPALRIEAERSYGNLVHDLPGIPVPQRLSWSWRIDKPNPEADLRRKSGDDSPVKVCLAFAMPIERVPFVERQVLRVARARSDVDLPTATLCWVWDWREAPGTALANAFTGRVRYIVLRGAADGAGRWRDESRDVAADFQRTFGDESPELPPLGAVIVSGDADNTGASTLAWVAALRFGP